MPPEASEPVAQEEAALAASFVALSVDGVEIGPFELIGISSGLDPSALALVRDSGRKLTLRKLPGRHPPAAVVLRRYQNADRTMFEWHHAALTGRPRSRRDTTLVFLDPDDRPAARYELHGAWPASIEISPFSTSIPVFHETVTLVCVDLERTAP